MCTADLNVVFHVGGYSWYDGSEVEYVYWGDGEPNEPDSFLYETCVKVSQRI